MYLSYRNYNKLKKLIENTINISIFKDITIVLIDIDFFNSTDIQITKEYKIEKIYNYLNSPQDFNLIYLGRDEFALIFEAIPIDGVMSKLLDLKNSFYKVLKTSFSAGIVEYPKHGEDIVEILRNLEESVYQAKNDGRNSISIADTKKLKLKSNYYTPIQLSRLSILARTTKRSEASLLREALDELLRKYEV
ncbi:diguanylate cyclase [Alkalihalobacillus sp. LMS39]|uniref:diguanylate cyclase domain-containing protein n=1 Tax=Alkalihalobacillus sp. LMS39 TaxID=2924032 RepID=UPI001FB3F4C7|nr:diguanylate cyclase [Alkalihalobacillus sp. LMS39]UOE95091.1 diguanylate cyclase [Alkalihalobacillus sp. LMS39]